MSTTSPSDFAEFVGSVAPTTAGNYGGCSQGLCGSGCNNEDSDALESHHRHFLAYKASWEKEREDMLDTIAALEERVRQNAPPRSSNAPCDPGCRKESAEVLKSHHHHFLVHKALWENDRKNMLDKSAALEKRLGQDASPNGSKAASPDTHKMASANHGSYYPTSYLRERTGNQARPGAAGRPNSLSDNRNSAQAVAGQLPSTAENVPPKSGRTTIDPLTQQHYDGIHFKSTASSSGSHSAQSGSSTAPSSLSRESPATIAREPPWTLQLPPASKANLTKHAGHTPMARTDLGLDGAGSAIGSDLSTPTAQVEQDAAPLEPPATSRPPSEHSDSYFPSGPADDDPELQQPLILKNEDSGDDEFMSQLQSKLHEASETSTPPAAVSAPGNSDEQYVTAEEMGFEQPEGEPPLRFKRALNFGSQLGTLPMREK
ncbi:MAG: hypothetical protein Q9172_007551 [Xanthocarpia lactea]